MSDDRGELQEPSIPETFLYSWESQCRQYDKVGTPGFAWESHAVTGLFDEHGTPVDGPVDCLLYRNSKGHLIGILNYYPMTTYESPLMAHLGMPVESAGNINLWVRPDRQGRHIGTRLILRAQKKHGQINIPQQRLTASGRAFAEKLIERRDEQRGGDRDA